MSRCVGVLDVFAEHALPFLRLAGLMSRCVGVLDVFAEHAFPFLRLAGLMPRCVAVLDVFAEHALPFLRLAGLLPSVVEVLDYLVAPDGCSFARLSHVAPRRSGNQESYVPCMATPRTVV